MKFKAAAIPAVFVLMAVLPIGAGLSAKINTEAPAVSTNDEADGAAEYDLEKICRIIQADFGSEYSDETLRALAILINTDSECEPDRYADEKYNSDTEISDEITSAAENSGEKKLLANGELLYVPYAVCSNGATLSGDYSYLTEVASPQDCFSENYSADNKCFGVSADGVEYLCSNGVSAEEALLYYLPNFEIEQ